MLVLKKKKPNKETRRLFDKTANRAEAEGEYYTLMLEYEKYEEVRQQTAAFSLGRAEKTSENRKLPPANWLHRSSMMKKTAGTGVHPTPTHDTSTHGVSFMPSETKTPHRAGMTPSD